MKKTNRSICVQDKTKTGKGNFKETFKLDIIRLLLDKHDFLIDQIVFAKLLKRKFETLSSEL